MSEKNKGVCDWSWKFGKDLISQRKSGNLKINGFCSLLKLYFCALGERLYIQIPPSSALGATIRGKNLLPGELTLSFKSNPQFSDYSFITVQVKNILNFWIYKRV